ncbi:hypothetical protein D9M68_540090 [compost metagenome]
MDTGWRAREKSSPSAGTRSIAEDCGACNVGTLVLTHHRPRDDVAMIERLREEVARAFHGRLIIANDLDEITL